MRGLNDLILRQGGLQAVLVPAAVLLGYGTAMLALGGHPEAMLVDPE